MKTNADNHSKNKNTIANAFARAREEHFQNMVDTLSDLLEDAMKKCLAKHDKKHPHHTDEPKETYGWILIHDGSVVRLSDGGWGTEMAMGFESQLKGEIEFNSGWLGIVCASMLPKKYFKWNYEVDIFNEVIPECKDRLEKLFEDRRKTK